MIWDLEERVEDAIVSHLTRECGNMRIYSAGYTSDLQFPCAIVLASRSALVVDSADFHTPRKVDCLIRVHVSAQDVLTSGQVTQTAREANATYRAAIITALSSDELKDQLISQQAPRVAFSYARLSADGISRDYDIDLRCFTTTIPLEVIAEPTEA